MLGIEFGLYGIYAGMLFIKYFDFKNLNSSANSWSFNVQIGCSFGKKNKGW